MHRSRSFREILRVTTAYAKLPDQLEYRLAATWPEARGLRGRDEVIEKAAHDLHVLL